MAVPDFQVEAVASELNAGLDRVHSFLYFVTLALEYIPEGEIRDGITSLRDELDNWHLRIENAVTIFNAVEADRQRLLAQ